MYHSILIAAVCIGLVCIAACISKPAAKTNVPEQNTALHATVDTLNIARHSVDDNPDAEEEIRRVLIKRGNVSGLATLVGKSGKMVVHICVDRSGKVISAKYDMEESSTRNANLARKAEEVAMQYEFEENESAPPEECSKMTFIFKRR